MTNQQKRPRLSHETAAHVFRYLADFAAAYPSMCEGEAKMYRDLARAALWALDNEQKAEAMLLARGVDDLLFRACREDVGVLLLRQLRKLGLRLNLTEKATLTVGPKEKLTAALTERIKRWQTALRDALLQEGLDEAVGLRKVHC